MIDVLNERKIKERDDLSLEYYSLYTDIQLGHALIFNQTWLKNVLDR